MNAQITKAALIETRRALTDMAVPRRPVAVLPAALVDLLEARTGIRISVGDIMVDTFGREVEVVEILADLPGQ